MQLVSRFLTRSPGAMVLEVLPSTSAEWLVWGLYALLVLFAIWLVLRLRLIALERQNDILEKLVEERTRELAEANRELERANAALQNISITDPLTGLKNRRFLTLFMEEEAAQAQRRYHGLSGEGTRNADLVFFMIDVDFFKEVNDRYGHAAGDQILLQLRDILCLAVRDADTVIRWGGEEFLIAARNTMRSEAPMLAERLRSLVEDYPFDVGGGLELRRTCSVGFAAYPFLPDRPDAVSWQDAAAIADLCLYTAKRSGRNAWVGLTAAKVRDASTLATRILDDPEAVIASGDVAVESSIAATNELAWRNAEGVPA